MKETLFRLWFTVLVCVLLGLVAKNVFGQTPKEAKPKVEAISIQVVPKVAIPNPWKRTTFHIRWRIEPTSDNRGYTLTCDCQGELISSKAELHGEAEVATRERFTDLLVLGNCVFEACLVKTTKTICVRQVVSTPEEPP